MKYMLAKLPYDYNALEPQIDAKTMEIHHDKHHQTYLDKLNGFIEKHPELWEKNAEDLLADLSSVPEDIRQGVKNNGGGFVNHNMFWEIMTSDINDRQFNGRIAEEISKTWGTLDNFKKVFSEAAMNRFGSGWCWLVLNDGKLEIMNTANQDSPLSDGKIPLLCLDVWEHAYYLRYNNRRAEYIEKWWGVVNWTQVNKNFEKANK